MECFRYLQNGQDLLSDVKTCERRFGEPFRGPVIPFGAKIEYHPISTKDQSRIHQFGKRVLPGIFLGHALYAGRKICKGDIFVADIEELEILDASEIHPRRLSATEVLIPKNGEHFRFTIADATAKLSGIDQVFRRSTSNIYRHHFEPRVKLSCA